jgi:hypothetical protein
MIIVLKEPVRNQGLFIMEAVSLIKKGECMVEPGAGSMPFVR